MIESIHNDKIKYLEKLSQKKYRDQEGLFLIEGRHLVEEASKTGYLEEVLSLKEENIKTTIVSQKVLNYLSNQQSGTDIIGICKKMDERAIKGNIVILDDIGDPGNLGTIIRSALAFNIDTIVLSKHSVDLYNPKVIRSTEGMLFHINILRRDLNEFIKTIKNTHKILGTSVEGGSSITKYHNVSNFALIIGSEGQGMHEELKKLCDDLIYIPMNNKCESLNAGVSASILMYELDKEQ